MNTESKNHYVIANGTVCTFGDDSLTIKFGPSVDPLAITFSFKEDETKKPGLKAIGEGKSLEVELYNFTNVLGTGNIEPMEIGTLEAKKLFINIRVYALSSSKTKTIHYTIFQEK